MMSCRACSFVCWISCASDTASASGPAGDEMPTHPKLSRDVALRISRKSDLRGTRTLIAVAISSATAGWRAHKISHAPRSADCQRVVSASVSRGASDGVRMRYGSRSSMITRKIPAPERA
jgi:hypothetical protein